jgi:lactobin A/cerein 7B family class IIb bacteriocin
MVRERRKHGVYIMRELNVNEIEQVNGGIIAWAVVQAFQVAAMVITFIDE